jgi:autotransporter-associated beta strand protein
MKRPNPEMFKRCPAQRLAPYRLNPKLNNNQADMNAPMESINPQPQSSFQRGASGLALLLAGVAVVFGLAVPTYAATKILSVTGGPWDYTTTNWSSAAFSSGDTAEFSSATTINAITLGSLNVAAGNIYGNAANTPTTTTVTGKATYSLTLGTGTAGTGNVCDAAGTGTAYAQNLTYSSADTVAATFFQLAPGSGTSVTPTIWNIASGKTFNVNGATLLNDTIDLGTNTVNLTGAGTVKLSGGGPAVQNGTLNVNAGFLQFGSGGSKSGNFKNSITVNVAPGATLQLYPNTGGGTTFAEIVNLNGGTLINGGAGVGGQATQSGAITLNSGGGTINSGSGGAFTLNGAIGGTGALTFASFNSASVNLLNAVNTYSGDTTISSSGVLTVGGSGSLGSGTYAGNITNGGKFTYNSSAAQTLSGVISGSGTLTKTNSSTLTLTGANTYTNSTTISGGTLAIGGAGQLASGSYAGNITNNATFNYNSSAAQTLSGIISGTGTLSKSGNGTLALSGANTYTNTTTSSGGTLKITGGLLDNTAITISGGTFGVQPGSATTLNLGNTLTVGAGATLNLGGNTFDMTDGAVSTCNLQQESTFAGAALTISSGATLKFNLGNASADLLAVSTAASVSGTVHVTLDASTATAWTGSPSFTILTAASGLNGGTWALTNPQVTVGGILYNLALAHVATSVTVTATPAYTVTYNGNGNTGGTTPVDGSSPYTVGSTVTVLGPWDLVKSGFAFNGWNTAADGSGLAYGPGSTFTSGANITLYAQWATPTATITSPSAFPGALTTIYGTASTPRSVSISGSGLTANIVATAPAGLEVSSDGSTYGPTATFTQSAGSASGTLYVRLKNNAPVSGNYNSLNVYLATTGAATVNTGTTGSGNTVSAKALTISSATAQNKLHDGNTSAAVVGLLQSAEAFGAGSSGDGKPYLGDTLTVGCTGSTFASPALGTWTVTAGTFTLGGASAGNYTLTQPSLSLSASILNTAVWTSTAASATWGTATNWLNGLVATNLDNTADFSQVDITADTTVSLTTPMTIGNLIFGDTDTNTPASWTLDNNATPTNILTLADTATVPTITVTNMSSTNSAIISAVVAGTAGLTKTGNGTLVLRGVNTYTGDTTISLGTLRMGASGQLGGGTYAGNLTNNGAFVYNSSAAQTLSGVISGAGVLATTSSGTLTLSGNNSYSGGTTNSGGILIAASANAFGRGPVTVATGAGATTTIINDGLTVTNDFVLNGGDGNFAGLLKNSGAGNATLSGGTITINGAPASGGHFSSSGTLTVADPINSPSTTVGWRSGNGIISGGGSYANFNLTGTLALGANNGLAANATVNIGVSGAATLDLAGYNQTLAGITKGAQTAMIINNSATSDSTLTTTGNSTYAGFIYDGSTHKVALTVNGGQLTLSSLNSYSGNTTLAGGILTLGSAEASGPSGPMGKGGTIVFGGGQLQYSAANSSDYSARFSTAASQPYNIDTAGQNVTYTNALTSSGGSLTLADSLGSGSLTLSGASTYSGATTVSSGKLYVNGSLNVASAVSVTGFAATLGGQGGVGAVIVSGNGGVEGGQGGVGVLTATSLTFSDFDTVAVKPNTTNAPVKVTASNGLNAAGGASSVTINLTGGPLLAGTYHLIQYSGSIQGFGFSAFQLGATPGGAYSYALANNAGYVDLQVTALADVWTGAFSSEWSINAITSPKNWTVSGVGPVDYVEGKDVLFNDAAANTTVNISVANVNPNSVVFFNSAKTYTLQGSQGIASIASGGLVKNGTGVLILNNTNSFSGDVTVNAGTLSVSDMENAYVNSPLGAGYNVYLGGRLTYTGAGSSSDRAVTLNSGSTIEVTAAPATLTLSGSVGGTAGLTKVGNGILNLAGNSFYSGDTTINAGTLAVGDPGTLGGGTYAGKITNNAAFVYASSASQTLSGTISGAGAMTQSGSGSLTLSGVNTYTADTTINGGTLTIGGFGQLGSGNYAANITNNGALVISSTGSQILSGRISGSGSVTMSGANTLTLSGANSYTNGTSVAAGSGLVTVQNNQSAANGGWTLGGATGAGSAATVNFDSSSTVGVAAGNQILVGSTTSAGTSQQTLNVAGTVNNNGLLNITRVGTVNLAAGAIWHQAGDLSLTGVGGYPAALNVNAGSSLTYNGTNTVQVNGADGNHGWSVLTIDGTGVFTTGAGFEETTAATTMGYGEVLLSNGGTIRLSSDVTNLTTQVQFSLGSGGGVIDNNGHNASLSGNVTVGNTSAGIFGSGSLTKLGNGILTLTGTNTYTGNTLINAGTLALSGGGSIASTANINVASGANFDVSGVTGYALLSAQTLSGSGTVNGAVTTAAGSTVAPGNSVGTLTFNNNLTLKGNLAIDVNKALSPAPSNDVLMVSGTLTNAGTGSVTVTNLGPALAVGDKFYLFNQAVVNGGGLTVTNSGPGVTWSNRLALDGSIVVAAVSSVASTNAYLQNLVVSGGTLSPAFVSNTLSYATTEAYANSPITVTPYAADAGASIQVIYAGATNTVASGSPSAPLALDPNPLFVNVVTVRVTAADATTTKDYTVNVTRLPSQTPPTLSRSVSGGTLTLSWPLDHNGYTLQTQTNSRSVGLTGTWTAVPGSSATNTMSFTINPTNPTVFFRLTYP